MDFMLEEELIDLFTFCLQNPDSPEVEEKKMRVKEILEGILLSREMCWKISFLQYQIEFRGK